MLPEGSPLAPLTQNPWLKEHIQIGPLGSLYPDVQYGMEGDTPSYISLIQVSCMDVVIVQAEY